MKEVKLVNFKIENKTLQQFDETCGIIPRSAYLSRMIENEIAAANEVRQNSNICSVTNNNQHGAGGACNE